MSKRIKYETPTVELLLLKCGLNLLDTLSIEGEIGDWTQEDPVNVIEVE